MKVKERLELLAAAARAALFSSYSEVELESEEQLVPPAPVDAVVSEFTWVDSGEIIEHDGHRWQPQTGTRTIITPAQFGGITPPLTDTREVDLGEIPIVVEPPVEDNTLVIFKRDVNSSRALIPENFGLGRYSRFQYVTEVSRPTTEKPDRNLFWFTVNDYAAGGVIYPFLATQYELHVSVWDRVSRTWSPMQLHKTIPVAAGAKRAAARIDVDSFPRGWLLIKLKGDPSEDGYEYPIYNNPEGTPIPEPEPYMPKFTGSYEIGHLGSKYLLAMVPSRYTPKERPIAPRVAEIFSTELLVKDITKENFLPIRQEIRRMNVTKSGVATTMDYQSYHWDRMIKRIPPSYPPYVNDVFGLQLLDGPRGVGTVSMLTHVIPRRTGGCWFADPWRFGEIKADGSIHTLIGVRHKLPMRQYQSACMDDFEIVGDFQFSGPYDMGEGWGFDFIPETLPLDMGAPPINGEQPHVVNPVVLLARAQYGDILYAEFNGHDRSAPAKVSRLITGLKDPWDIVCPPGGIAYISERKANRIIGVDVRKDSPTFGQIVKVLIDGGAAAAAVAKFNDSDRTMYVTDTAQAKACQCLGPEGLALLDNELFFSGRGQSDIRVINLNTGEMTKLFDIPLGARYVKLAVSDGSFLPKGTLFTTTWSNLQSGFPLTYRRDGTKINWYNVAGTSVPWGKGGPWEGIGYASAFNIKFGWAMASSSMEGIVRFSKAQAGDPVVSSEGLKQYVRGRTEWEHEGYQIIWGVDGNSFEGIPLPLNLSEDVKYFLKWNGTLI